MFTNLVLCPKLKPIILWQSSQAKHLLVCPLSGLWFRLLLATTDHVPGGHGKKIPSSLPLLPDNAKMVHNFSLQSHFDVRGVQSDHTCVHKLNLGLVFTLNVCKLMTPWNFNVQPSCYKSLQHNKCRHQIKMLNNLLIIY